MQTSTHYLIFILIFLHFIFKTLSFFVKIKMLLCIVILQVKKLHSNIGYKTNPQQILNEDKPLIYFALVTCPHALKDFVSNLAFWYMLLNLLWKWVYWDVGWEYLPQSRFGYFPCPVLNNCCISAKSFHFYHTLFCPLLGLLFCLLACPLLLRDHPEWVSLFYLKAVFSHVLSFLWFQLMELHIPVMTAQSSAVCLVLSIVLYRGPELRCLLERGVCTGSSEF